MLGQVAKSVLQNNSGKVSAILKNRLANFAISAGGEGPNGLPEPADVSFVPRATNLGKWCDAVVSEYVHGDKVAKGYGQVSLV